MAAKKSLVLRRLKNTIEKVKFLLSTNLAHWLYIGSAASATRRLSFKDQPGLLDIVSSPSDDGEEYHDAASSLAASRTGSPAPAGIFTRTMSSLWSEISGSPGSASASGSASRTASDASALGDDVDKRADAFIASFWQHLQMERQFSLELRYCKSNSLERTASD